VAESSSIPFATVERLRLSAAQLATGVRLACCIFPEADLHVTIEHPTPPIAWRALRADEYSELALPLTVRDHSFHYGVAIDLGTTHLRLTLWDVNEQRRLAGLACLNPQGSYGADILSRLMEAVRTEQIADEMRSLIQQIIAEALRDIAAQAAIDLHKVGRVLIVGNTAMLCLLSGENYAELLQPENWTRRIAVQPTDIAFLQTAWNLGAQSDIRFITPAGGFIGSDLLAGIIATRLIEQPAGSLLIDFGTNSEMALWDGTTLHVTATAGGPAFEGCGISCGMTGEAGAIYRVEQVDVDDFKIKVLGQEQPRGLCGSGLVDAVAWLRRNHKLDKVGRFTQRSSAGFVLEKGRHSVLLKPGDIDILQRAKAAIGAGVQWICHQAGIMPGELSQVIASGAFGRLLNINNAQAIGLLPPVALGAVRLEGNTALAGCEALLLCHESAGTLEAVLSVCKVYNMGEDASFETLFIENLYLQPMQA
jgi:uncharacterized 2Fe-2S/4Fe-4S cluster protein (DUF4445 family)